TQTWTLDDYACAIEQALLGRGIDRGWLLGESFGSQPAWALIAGMGGGSTGAQTEQPAAPGSRRSRPGFQVEGLILAGGFVRHPAIWAVRLAGRVSRTVPMRWVKLFCVVYARYARFRHKRAPETLASIAEFVANR